MNLSAFIYEKIKILFKITITPYLKYDIYQNYYKYKFK